MARPQLLGLLALVAGIAPAQRPAPETQTIRLRANQNAGPDRLYLKIGDHTAYVEWKQDRNQDAAIYFGAFSPCVEGPEIRVQRGHGLCSLKPALCTADNASNGRCDFRYRTPGGESAIVADENYAPPRPGKLKGAFAPGGAGARKAQTYAPGDSAVIHTRNLELDAAAEVTVGNQPAVVARTLSPHEAEIIVPQVDDGKAQVVVTSGGKTERVGSLTIWTAVSRRLTLAVNYKAVNGKVVSLLKSEPHAFAAPPCVQKEPAEAPILYSVIAAGVRVGCGVLKASRPAELFLPAGPRRDMSRGDVFTIVVPWIMNESVEFSPGDSEKLSRMSGFEPGKTPQFNSIKVTY